MYEGWDLHHRVEVEFEQDPPTREQEREPCPDKKTITLEPTVSNEGESQMWDFIQVTPLKVKINSDQMA